ncbi:MAG: hypothetical protein KGQ41_08000, partial [Alphaproteobacteria bacterium]|nr:hypothetical protein [Alphaproteobacteria bacterium]
MKSRLGLHFFKSLAFMATFSLFILTISIMGVGGYFIITRMYDVTVENAERESRNMTKLVATTIARPMWNLNKAGGAANLRALS